MRARDLLLSITFSFALVNYTPLIAARSYSLAGHQLPPHGEALAANSFRASLTITNIL
jgi:hypothetical protein